jgi:hypothetical protein
MAKLIGDGEFRRHDLHVGIPKFQAGSCVLR